MNNIPGMPRLCRDPGHPQPMRARRLTSGRSFHVGSVPLVSGPAEFFTGGVGVDPVYAANGEINASGGLVTFDPGARQAWHNHPKGQYLYVTAGAGPTQEWGGLVQQNQPGDMVWCPPRIKHLHGEVRATGMTHLAVTGTIDGKNMTWMEKVAEGLYIAR